MSLRDRLTAQRELGPGIERGIKVVIVMALMLVVGLFAQPDRWDSGLRSPKGEPTRTPLPHQVAKYPGMASLRLAMVHDILHERYTRRGAAWHHARLARCEPVVAAATDDAIAPDERLLQAMDDCAASYDRLDRAAEAEALMRRKLALLDRHHPSVSAPAASSAAAAAVRSEVPDAARFDDHTEYQRFAELPELDRSSYHRYSGEANLGTAIAHASLRAMLKGDAAARERMQEALAHVRASLAINPGAHFGREAWQATVYAHLIAVAADPTLAQRFDLIGNELAAEPEAPRLTTSWRDVRVLSNDYRTLLRDEPSTPIRRESESRGRLRLMARALITRVGAAPAWLEVVDVERRTPAPFDEPTLALIGIWTLGSGPSPLAAMTLGGIMERVGQRHLAWTAYERALAMRDKLPFAAEISEALVAHCRTRQERIAVTETLNPPAGWEQALRTAHLKELAHGSAYQAAYEAFEAERLAAGIAYDAPDLMAGFVERHGAIATTPGDEDWLLGQGPPTFSDRLPLALLAAGVIGLLALAISRRPAGR